ncbi:origin recognition complex subunit 3 [Tanacetum coccineum]
MKRNNDGSDELDNFMMDDEQSHNEERGCLKGGNGNALSGDPRRRIQLDLLECHNFLKCSCCSKSSNSPCSSMHDTTLMLNALSQRQVNRDGTFVGLWNSSNVEALMKHTVDKGFTIHGWELVSGVDPEVEALKAEIAKLQKAREDISGAPDYLRASRGADGSALLSRLLFDKSLDLIALTFCLMSQRVALSTAASVCKKLLSDAADFVMEAVPYRQIFYHDMKELRFDTPNASSIEENNANF